MQATVERLRAARALYATTDARYEPSLAIRTNEPIDPDASASYFQVGFDARWELPFFGRGQANRNVRRGRLVQAATNVRQARVSLVAEAVRDWIGLRAAQQRVELAKQMADAQQRRVKMLKVRAGLGLTSPNSIADAQSDVSDTQLQLLNARHAVAAAGQQLALLLGRNEPDPAWLHVAALPTLHRPGPVSVPARLLQTRPGIALARARVVEAAGDLGLAQADRYPSIGLGASLVASAPLTSYHASQISGIGTFGPTIDIPLFDWGLRKARANARGHLLEAASLSYRETVLQGVAEVETSLDDLQRTQQQLQGRAIDLKNRESSVKRATRRHRLGLDNASPGLAAEMARNRARLRLVAARAAHDSAYVALYKALGGASDANIRATR